MYNTRRERSTRPCADTRPNQPAQAGTPVKAVSRADRAETFGPSQALRLEGIYRRVSTR